MSVFTENLKSITLKKNYDSSLTITMIDKNDNIFTMFDIIDHKLFVKSFINHDGCRNMIYEIKDLKVNINIFINIGKKKYMIYDESIFTDSRSLVAMGVFDDMFIKN